MGGVLQYKWEVYCWVSLSSRLRSQEGTAIQIGRVLPYKLDVYCRTFFETSRGWGFRNSSEYQVRKNSLNIKFLGGIFLGHPGPRRRDILDKNFMQVALFCCFGQGVARMSRDSGRDVSDLEKLYARKLWADFWYPTISRDIAILSLRYPILRDTF